ncbi:RINT1-like protein [Mya arenaria]|uniref:RINT1-like protein n=1 Tax=Mya arenaria TaxID=6604 RepID=A0ABY7DL29_MYAAR|nr:RINT1-like protein [Mya arenaria]
MAASSEEISQSEKFAIDFVNTKFSDKIKTLKSLKNIYLEQKQDQEQLKKKLSLASSEVPSELEQGIKDAEKARTDVRHLRTRQETLYHNIQDHTRTLADLVKETSRLTEEVDELEHLSHYLSCLIHIDTLSSHIETLLKSESPAKAVDKFTELSQLFSAVKDSKCRNIVKFSKDTTMYWYNNLKDKIASEFEEVLKQLKWPLVGVSIKSPPTQNVKEARTRMDTLFTELLKLQLPDCLSNEVENVPASLNHIKGLPTPTLPLQVMIKPLRRRFRFHFFGSKQTNDIGKPEWYFTQILSWTRDHLDFLEQRVQPLLKQSHRHTHAKTEFMVGMMTLVLEKMVHDLPELINDDHQFSHLVDEALLFDREVRESYGYPASLPGALHILSQPTYFNKWLQIERKFGVEKLDGMMSSPGAWDSQYRGIADVDELRVPECGDSFVTLLLTITDRYKPLPHPTQQLQFLDLQLELLEDFRVRLTQVKNDTHNPLDQRYSAILNTAHFVAEVLREWSELVESDTGDIPFGYTTVFDEMISLYERLKNDMLNTMVSQVFIDVRARGKPYKDDRWIALPYQKEVTLGLSISACEMFLVLKDHLLEVSELISKPIFTLFWEAMTHKMNMYIFEEIILRNKFNQGGAAQLHFDMTRNLFPLFGEYTLKPDSYFKEVKEACILLTTNVGSALLLKEVLYEALHRGPRDTDKITEARSALTDLGVHKLTLDQAELVLNVGDETFQNNLHMRSLRLVFM